MNRYDKEVNIINDFHDLKTKEIMLQTEDKKTISILESIYLKRKWKNWVDSSAKNEPPPDFYNTKEKLMMDVMRIDDHSYVNENGKIINPHNQRESNLLNELISKNSSIKAAAEKGHVFIVPRTNLPTDEDHNYRFYVDSFNRVIKKHISKIKKYKDNHPDFDMIFFIADESSPYIIPYGKKKVRFVGEGVRAELHYFWLDKNMMSCLKDSNVDYVIWMAPYKHFESEEKVELPQAIIINLKTFNYDELIDYKDDEMQSLEL